MLIIFTGNGKGKTTAALGQALRAVGENKKALMVQLIKGPWKSGEDESHQRLLPDFVITKKGKGFVGILGDTYPIEVHINAVKEGMDYALSEVKTNKWNMLIMDEIWNALLLNLVKKNTVQKFIKDCTPHVEHLIMTGRDCPQEFIEKADLVTEMREIKHPYMKGAKAMKGVEY